MLSKSSMKSIKIINKSVESETRSHKKSTSDLSKLNSMTDILSVRSIQSAFDASSKKSERSCKVKLHKDIVHKLKGRKKKLIKYVKYKKNKKMTTEKFLKSLHKQASISKNSFKLSGKPDTTIYNDHSLLTPRYTGDGKVKSPNKSSSAK